MEQTLHYGLLAAHTLFQKAFLLRLSREYPELLPGQPKVIDYLMVHDKSFQREIADGCLIEPATLCPILEKMERAGFLRRDKADGNKKNSVVSLTAKGRETGIRLQELFVEVETAMCAGISPLDEAVLKNCLSKIGGNGRELLA